MFGTKEPGIYFNTCRYIKENLLYLEKCNCTIYKMSVTEDCNTVGTVKVELDVHGQFSTHNAFINVKHQVAPHMSDRRTF